MNRTLKRSALGLVVALATLMSDIAQAQSARERGQGPYTLVTRRGEVTVRILRREGDMVWVDRQVSSGNWVETGIPKSEIIEFKSPRPPLFDLAEKAETPEQISAAIDQLRRMVSLLRIYRDLPGIPVHEATLLQAQLNERREYWRDALQLYEELLGLTYEMKDRPVIRYRAGLCLWNMQQKERALTYLLDDPIPDDDLDLLSAVLNARADSLSAMGRHREAIDTYLSMIVFYPYAQNNEARALAGILPSYIALQDWDAVMKAIEDLQRDYAETPYAAEADKVMAAHAKKVEAEKQFQVNQ